MPAMKQDHRAEAQGLPVTTLLTGPGRQLRVGDTLVCPTCAVSGVVRALPSPPGDGPICHGPMKLGRPVPCAEVRPRRSAGLRDQVRDFLTGELEAGSFVSRCDSWLTGFDAQFSRRVGERGWIGAT